MKTKIDSPGIPVPPPLYYVVIFMGSVFLQKQVRLSNDFFETKACTSCGMVVVAVALIVLLPALYRFYKTRNTLITIKPARSLQTTGIYAFTRNPMYLGLLILYTGIAFFKGNPWTFIAIPVVLIVITFLVIRPEENYLNRAFGEDYAAYKNRVRRWL